MGDNSSLSQKCPVNEAVKIISKKWVILIVRDMFFGKTHFNQFKEDKPNLSNKVLSNCLKEMESNSLIIRIVNPEDNKNTEYKLTDKGLVLNKVIYELACFTLATDIDNKYYTDKTKKDIEKTFKELLNIK